MTGLLTEPQLINTAAGDVAEIRSAIGAAKAAAAGPTTGVAAAAADEVSAAAATLFGSYAQEYQAVLDISSDFSVLPGSPWVMAAPGRAVIRRGGSRWRS